MDLLSLKWTSFKSRIVWNILHGYIVAEFFTWILKTDNVFIKYLFNHVLIIIFWQCSAKRPKLKTFLLICYCLQLELKHFFITLIFIHHHLSMKNIIHHHHLYTSPKGKKSFAKLSREVERGVKSATKGISYQSIEKHKRVHLWKSILFYVKIMLQKSQKMIPARWRCMTMILYGKATKYSEFWYSVIIKYLAILKLLLSLRINNQANEKRRTKIIKVVSKKDCFKILTSSE